MIKRKYFHVSDRIIANDFRCQKYLTSFFTSQKRNAKKANEKCLSDFLTRNPYIINFVRGKKSCGLQLEVTTVAISIVT